MASMDDEELPKGICQNFVPQQWRKSKCKLCFQDVNEHTKGLSLEESEELLKNCLKLDGDCQDNDSGVFTATGGAIVAIVGHDENLLGRRRNENGRQILASSSTIVGDNDQNCFNSQSNYTISGNSSKGSSERLDVDYTEDSNLILHPTDDETADESQTPTPITRRRRKKISPSYNFDFADSHDAEDGSMTPRTSKRRTRSYRKNSSNLLQLSAMVRSSNSSLCSFTSELTDGYSDYDYDLRSITDDTDDYAEIPDVIEELELIKPELKIRVENERRVSRSKIIHLERELEGQQDYYRASEVAKDRQIKSVLRDIEGLKLELSSVKAHENILALKSRLELEGKNSRISDLEQQVKSLQEELSDLSKAPHSIELQHDFLNKELERALKRITQLDEENRSTEERMKLAEDLKHNDKELIDILRGQCNSLEKDLTSEQDRNTVLEEKLKHMDLIRADLVKEQEKCTKVTKEVEAMRQKIKRRDRHIEDLEDDNVKLQQLKQDVESQIAKKEIKLKKGEKKISELQNEVTKCNKEIADLTGENKTLEQVRRLTDLQLKDMKTDTSEVTNGERLFIHTLEDRLKHRESRLKELELENDNLLREIKELYESLLLVEKQGEEYKELLKENESSMNKMRNDTKHNEKKVEMLHRKLQKSEKEKRRALNKQNNAEMKLLQYQEQACIRTETEALQAANYDSGDDSDSRILKLKLQSTEARLSMIEVNKGYLETKVLKLERKLIDKEQELLRLNDSIERDSGAPSQDNDRFDVLERENIMLQTKLDEVALENTEQKEVVSRLKEDNNNLEKTLQTLNTKLETCSIRLREVEEANHKLGREAIKRNQTLSTAQYEVESSLNELREHNKELQEKVKHYDEVEELVERLEGQVKTGKTHVQWYFDENEKLKIETAKMADTIRTLECVKFEFEQSVHELSETNKDLNNDVKRLEQKLEIYGELFDKDSNISLKRRSYQGDYREQDDERLITNALAPLMEEIKEKDAQIRSLQKAAEEKDKTINYLNKEIDLLETNLAAMVTEKIRNMNVSSDVDKIRNDSNPATLFSSKLRSRSAGDVFASGSNKAKAKTAVDENNHPVRIGRPYTLVLTTSEIEPSDRNRNTTPPENSPPKSPPRETFLALTSIPSPVRKISLKEFPSKDTMSTTCDHDTTETTTTNTNLRSSVSQSPITTDQSSIANRSSVTCSSSTKTDALSVSTEAFYQILHEHEEIMKMKDEQCNKRLSGGSETTDNGLNIYHTIESALLDQYREDGQNLLPSSIPSLSGSPRVGERVSFSITDVKSLLDEHINTPPGDHATTLDKSRIAENKAMLDDMYDELAQLEDLVTSKYPSKKISSNEIEKTKYTETEESALPTPPSSDTGKNNSESPPPQREIPVQPTPKLNERHSISLGLPSSNTYLCRTPSTSSTLSHDSNSIDLSALDDLLAEVDRRSSGSHEKYATVAQESTNRRVSPAIEQKPPITPKAMPSIRTTKRRIIKLGGLNRSGSFDSATKRSYVASAAAIASRSSSSLPHDPHFSTHDSTVHSCEVPSAYATNESEGNSPSSSITSSASSMASVVFLPNKCSRSMSMSEGENILRLPVHNNTAMTKTTTTPPYRRPKLDGNKFLGPPP